MRLIKCICLGLVLFSTLGCGKDKEKQNTPLATTSSQQKAFITPLPQSPPSSIDLEKEKALKNPYPNDFGPAHIDISNYAPALQEGYNLLTDKCAKCHSASRPLNSQYVELTEQEIAQVKKSQPGIFKDKLIWQIEPGIWQRYVKRMMAKPGCNISSDEGKKIWKFLAEDSKRRKMSSDAKTWETSRKNLIAQFKAKYPERHQELFSPEN